MNGKHSHVKHSQRGTVVLEFGLAFLVFFSVIYGIMEFGRIVASYNILSAAAREGVRYAVVHGSASGSVATASDIQDVVRRWAIGMDASAVVVTTTWTPGNAPGNQVQVNASYTISPFTALILKNDITLQSSSQMAISQ
jgi:Flp pilus assembly protein TadG